MTDSEQHYFEQNSREQLVRFAQKLNSSGLSAGKSGNISLRYNDSILITPSGLDYSTLSTQHIVRIDQQGKALDSQNEIPSSEWPFHCKLYATRPDIQAIVHAHPVHATALACTGRSIPAFHYMVAIAGGNEIPIAPYALFGSDTLSDNIAATLKHHNACLLANHGIIAIGNNLEKAFNLAMEIENLAEQYCTALQLGNVNILSDEQMNDVLEKFKHYGQRT